MTELRPKISVVVSVRGAADDLAACLDSIAAQTVEDLQVIMVDDGSIDSGSIDGSAAAGGPGQYNAAAGGPGHYGTAIAKDKSSADPRFGLIQPSGDGSPGFARNRGIEAATGEFLAFADGDVVLPPDAYELLLHTLEGTRSDFASGQVFRIGPDGVDLSAPHAMAIEGRHTGVHIADNPQLLDDVLVSNKLFRRSFWDLHELRYPEGMAWEDTQLMTTAHVLAQQVDVIDDPVCFCRDRVRRRSDTGDLRDRVAALTAIDALLTSYGPGKLRPEHQIKALRNDLWLYVRDMHQVSQAYRAEFGLLAAGYLDTASPKVLRALPATHKLAYQLVRQGAMPELAEFAGWLAERPADEIPLVRRRFRLEADLPFWKNKDLSLPPWVYRPQRRDLEPRVRVDDVACDGDKLVVTGRVNAPSMDVAKRRNTSKIVLLRAEGRRSVVLRAKSFPHPEASEQARYSCDWSGFRFEVDSRRFDEPETWEAYLLVRGRSGWRSGRVRDPVPGPAQRPAAREVAPGVRFGAEWTDSGLNLVTREVEATLAAYASAGEDRPVTLEVSTAGVPARTAEFVLVRGDRAATRTVPATRIAEGRFRGDVPVDLLRPALTPDSGAPSASSALSASSAPSVPSAPSGNWDIYLKAGGRSRVRVAWPEEMAEGRWLSGGREIVVGRDRRGDLVMAERMPCPVIDSYSWLPGGRLELRGSFLGTEGAYETLLRRVGSGDVHVIGFRLDGERFVIEADVERMPFFGTEVPLRDGEWKLFVRAAGSAAEVELKYDHDALGSVAGDRVGADRKWYRFIVTGLDDPLITAEPRLPAIERGNHARRALRREYYPRARRAPVRDSVLFVSWQGQRCGDNPLGIAAELRRRGDDREHVWVVDDWSIPVPAGGTGVLRGTREYFDALAQSRWIVSNDEMRPPFRKRDGQFYVQTWHGTPLKRIGFDIENPRFIGGASYFGQLARDVAQWDLLVSPNPFSTTVLRRAFRYSGEIAEYGYPRNDVLRRPDAAAVADAVRARLGLPAGKRVVLYAPTWRDDQVDADGRRYRFDLRLDLEQAFRALGDEYVFLIRGHHRMADDVPRGLHSGFAGHGSAVAEHGSGVAEHGSGVAEHGSGVAYGPGFAVNVSTYPDISELFMVSDVLVTDYSSAMFDYAVTGRPMLFFTYDLADYRDSLRGFYFDFEAEAPGPLLSTSAEVVAALADVNAAVAPYARAYQRFAGKFTPLDDGHAGARLCDHVF